MYVYSYVSMYTLIHVYTCIHTEIHASTSLNLRPHMIDGSQLFILLPHLHSRINQVLRCIYIYRPCRRTRYYNDKLPVCKNNHNLTWTAD